MPHKRVELMFRGAYELRLSPEGRRKRRQGEIFHLALSFVRDERDRPHLPLFVRRALALLGEKAPPAEQERLGQHLEAIFDLPEAKLFFSPQAQEVFNERDILLPWSEGNKKQVLRPDRVVLFKDRAVVIDFKSETELSEEIRAQYHAQVRHYARLVKRLFSRPTEGYLLFVLGPRAERVV